MKDTLFVAQSRGKPLHTFTDCALAEGMDVNSAKFASITPDLVVRKGEARPWPQAEPLQRSPRVVAPPPDDEDPLEADEIMPAPVAQDGTRRCSFRLSPCEFERVGIIAVKRNTSRQQILRAALEEYLSAVELEFGGNCSCLGAGGCRSETGLPHAEARSGPGKFRLRGSASPRD
jgi:hypothetical protein